MDINTIDLTNKKNSGYQQCTKYEVVVREIVSTTNLEESGELQIYINYSDCLPIISWNTKEQASIGIRKI